MAAMLPSVLDSAANDTVESLAAEMTQSASEKVIRYNSRERWTSTIVELLFRRRCTANPSRPTIDGQ